MVDVLICLMGCVTFVPQQQLLSHYKFPHFAVKALINVHSRLNV